MKTMNDVYEDESDDTHLHCPNCGLCSTCGDCRCNKPSPCTFILNGYPRSGKNVFADFLLERLEDRGIYGSVVSSVDDVKEAAKILGWNGVKDEEGRNALSSLKDWSTLHFNGPYRVMQREVKNLQDNEVVIFMVREPKEISRFVKQYPNTVTIFVERDDCETAQNHADLNCAEYTYDFYITNNSTLKNLNESAVELIKFLYKEIN